ncbi:MAG: InlB B-repeat-containing protein, partial [Candidatus Natronoplasma sp.]
DTTSETTTIEVLGDYSITAEFEEDVVEVATYELVVEIDGNGSVTMDPDESEYDEGTDVTLNATADEGWEFVGWIGDATGGDTMVNITMDENKSITANFEEQVAEFEVTNFEAEVDGLEVTVTADVENIGNIEGSLDLIIDGEVVDTVTLGPGDTDEFEYNGEFDEDGDYDIDFGEESDTVNAEGDSLDTGEDSSNITMIVGILLIIVVILAIIGYVMKSGGEEADPAMEEEMFEEPEETEEEPIEEETIEEETGEETGEEPLEEEGEFDEEVPEEESENEEM